MSKIIRDPKHRYSHDEGQTWYPGVTTILGATIPKPALVNWAVKVTCDYIDAKTTDGVFLPEALKLARKEATRIKEDAADVGTMVHDWIDSWATFGPDVIGDGGITPRITDPRVNTAVQAFLEWAEQNRLKPIQSEQYVIHQKLQYGGTLDLIADIQTPEMRRPKKYLIDIKSAKAHYPEHLYQVAAYAACAAVEGIGVLRLDRNTGLHDWKDYTKQQKHGWRVFKACRELYRALHEEGK